MLPLISEMEAHCETYLDQVPGYQAVCEGGAHCIHCMQDHMIGVRPEDPDSAHAFVMKCKSCDYHRFYGRSDADMSNEKGAPG